MNLASLSLAALALAILLSCTTRLNVGFVALALAWLLGLIANVDAAQVMSGFPAQLFLTLVGVTLLFTQAEVNGTLTLAARFVLRAARGNPGVMAIMFFVIAGGLATLGGGAIAASALVAPLAMGAAGRVGIPAFLMAVLVGNGANAGNLSPFSPVGVIVDGILTRNGLAGYEWRIFLNNFVAHCVVGALAFLFLGGRRLLRQPAVAMHETSGEDPRWERRNIQTFVVINLLIAGVVLLRLPVGMAAFAAAVLLTALRAAPEEEVIARMPWGVMIMVSGVTVLIAMLERTGGMDLFSSLIARFSTPATITAVIAFVCGIVSAYSSTSGVVLPAFLPLVPKLVQQLGGGEPIAIVSAINLGGHLVDVSPLSTIGALCIAAASADVDRRRLFNQLFFWGLSMAVVAALASWVLFGPVLGHILARP